MASERERWRKAGWTGPFESGTRNAFRDFPDRRVRPDLQSQNADSRDEICVLMGGRADAAERTGSQSGIKPDCEPAKLCRCDPTNLPGHSAHLTSGLHGVRLVPSAPQPEASADDRAPAQTHQLWIPPRRYFRTRRNPDTRRPASARSDQCRLRPSGC